MSPEDLVQGTIKLASLPDVYFKINEMVNDATSSASDIGKVISSDAALAARLLKIANSSIYCFPSQIDSISRAITIIGNKGLRDLALATYAINSLSNIPCDMINMEKYWEHSLYCGIFSRLLAAKCNSIHTEPFFISGLLHDVGQLVIVHKIPEYAKETHVRSMEYGRPLHEIENEIMSFDHATVGCELLTKWQLPASIVDSVFHHHNPEAAKISPLGAAIVHIGDLLAHMMAEDQSIEEVYEAIDQSAADITGLVPDDLQVLIDEAKIQFNTSRNLFVPAHKAA